MAFAALAVVSCDEDDDDIVNIEDESEFTSLEAPYLICANRNPGGVGFDFVYDGSNGGANNMDSPSVDDFEYDIVIKTIKGEKNDGSLGGAPYIQLDEGVKAVNYSAIYATCVGITQFNALSASDLEEYTFSTDDASFDTSSLTTGDTGFPMMSGLLNEYKKLVIGQTWKTTSNNDVEEDELIWIIQTQEGRLVKFIVTDFPADPAPTSTGYIAVTWDFLD